MVFKTTVSISQLINVDVLENFFCKNNGEFEPVVLHTLNPMNSKKMGDKFFMDFSFFTHRFFNENLWFFSQCQMPWRYVELSARSKEKKTYFWGIHSCLRRLLGLEWDYCTNFLAQILTELQQFEMKEILWKCFIENLWKNGDEV